MRFCAIATAGKATRRAVKSIFISVTLLSWLSGLDAAVSLILPIQARTARYAENPKVSD
jgi:hypothetical protein